MNSILSVFVSKETEPVPVSCLPGARDVLVRKETKVNVFSREFELIHKNAWVALVNSNLLVSMDSNKGKADLFNINIMHSWVSKDVICV